MKHYNFHKLNKIILINDPFNRQHKNTCLLYTFEASNFIFKVLSPRVPKSCDAYCLSIPFRDRVFRASRCTGSVSRQRLQQQNFKSHFWLHLRVRRFVRAIPCFDIILTMTYVCLEKTRVVYLMELRGWQNWIHWGRPPWYVWQRQTRCTLRTGNWTGWPYVGRPLLGIKRLYWNFSITYF